MWPFDKLRALLLRSVEDPELVEGSGHWESNPVYTNPFPPKFRIVGVPGFEPGLHEPESCVLPLYDTPKFLAGERAYYRYTMARFKMSNF